MSKSKSWQISRRTMLRGLGAMMALPPLEIMGKATGAGSGQPAEAPMRFISLFQPNGVYPGNWAILQMQLQELLKMWYWRMNR